VRALPRSKRLCSLFRKQPENKSNLTYVSRGKRYDNTNNFQVTTGIRKHALLNLQTPSYKCRKLHNLQLSSFYRKAAVTFQCLTILCTDWAKLILAQNVLHIRAILKGNYEGRPIVYESQN
jgi:hypothetical protein